MRIIGGKYRGRKLITPANQDIRPTSDRMRETIFNILSHGSRSLEGALVLDVFAGTGALGIEALSRGAAHVTFFDQDQTALALVKKNVALIGAQEKTTLKCEIAPNLPRSNLAFDFVFLDPPYNLNLINETLTILEKNNYLADNCMIIAEYNSNNTLIINDNFSLLKEKTYGDARFSYLEKIS